MRARRLVLRGLANLVDAVDAEADQEHVQQGRVIRVLDVLHVELPVALEPLALIADDAELLSTEDAREVVHHVGADEIGEGLRRVIESREHRPVDDFRLQSLQSELGGIEIFGEATLTLYAAPERDAGEVAFEVVAPLVIGAAQDGPTAELLLTDLGAAMSAAVEQHVDAAI